MTHAPIAQLLESPDQDARKAYFATDAYLEGNALIPIRARLVGELLTGLTGSRILDLGCGNGAVSLPLLANNNQLTLVDRSRTMLDSAKAQVRDGAPVELVQADVLEYRPDRLYDAVICVGVLAHIATVEGLITRVADAVRSDGLCVIQITDDAQWLGYVINRYSRIRYSKLGRRNEMTFRELADVASHHGLELVATRRYGLAPPGFGLLPYAWRLRLEETATKSARVSRLGSQVLASFQKKVT